MYKIDFNKKVHVYFCGIGGISMSGMAELLHSKGFSISGSDSQMNSNTEHLESKGITIFYGQVSENITKSIDLFVYTAAIHEDNQEFIAAKELQIPMLSRAQLIGQIMLNYKNAIAVSGTHGKTTTTSMMSMILLEAQMDPTISVGGLLDAIDGNLRIGDSPTFITEACEYTNSFLNFHPSHSIVLNVEAEHLDFFKDLNDIRNSFKTFIDLLPSYGALVINGEINQVEELYKDCACQVITYGIAKEAQNNSYTYCAKNISYDSFGHGSYDLFKQDVLLGRISLKIVGRHNISNSLATIALSLELGISLDIIEKALLKFTGTQRRFELKGMKNGITIVDDYAHHPTEIKASLNAAKLYPHKDIWCAFQPHTYTRTKNFLKDFANALSLADHIVLADIYAAREKDPGDISSADLKKELEELGKDVYYYHSFEEIEDILIKKCTNGDLLITMGAGNIVTVGESILTK